MIISCLPEGGHLTHFSVSVSLSLPLSPLHLFIFKSVSCILFLLLCMIHSSLVCLLASSYTSFQCLGSNMFLSSLIFLTWTLLACIGWHRVGICEHRQRGSDCLFNVAVDSTAIKADYRWPYHCWITESYLYS